MPGRGKGVLGRAISSLIALIVAAAAVGATPAAPEAQSTPFNVVETTIADIHTAMTGHRLTCHALVAAYLARIAAYDKQGPSLNAIVELNPNALAEADELDRRFTAQGLTGPLHCIPAIVKDNFETIGLQSADGSASLKGFVSNKDAFLVKKIKDAGAIVLAKSNMAEFAFSPYETINSILPGYTFNPYALDRVTAGSSGGTAAAVAASFGAIGLGSDTGNSIRGPSSHQALVGIRSTMGLTSRAGVIPLSFLADVAGPMCRTVTDAATVFQAIVGEDPADPATATATSHGRAIPNYLTALVKDGLKGARIGVLHQAYERGPGRSGQPAVNTNDPDVMNVFAHALEELKAAGAEIVDPAPVDTSRAPRPSGACRGFKYDINEYLAAQGDRVPVHSLEEIISSKKFHPSVEGRLQQAEQQPLGAGPGSEACQADAAYRAAYGAAVTQTMDDLHLSAFVYPTWSNVPRLIGDLTSPAGDNSQVFSPTSGFPAINVPMGFTRNGMLPAGMTFFGRAWDEATLIKLAYAYEQATHHRKPPPTTPALR
jgi:amidase